MTYNGQKFKGWTATAIALVSFAAGSLMATRLSNIGLVKAENNHLFELRVYHVVPGKMPTMESRFRQTTSKLLAKHNLNVVGYWTSEESTGSDNTFVFLLSHQNREEARKNWNAMGTDPDFLEVIKSEQTDKTLEKAEVMYMLPTDFSAMK